MLRPTVRDAWRVALHRSLGSVAGVILVVLLAVSLPKELPLQVPAIVLGITTVLIAIHHGHPAPDGDGAHGHDRFVLLRP
jgi:uncharacterized membrane protein YccC